MTLKDFIALSSCLPIMIFACNDADVVEQEMTGGSPLMPFEGGSIEEGGEPITQSGLPVGSTCEEPYDCKSLLCFAEIEADSGVCVRACVDEPDVCGEGFTCRSYAGYGSICVPNEGSVSTDMGSPEVDMDPLGFDMGSPEVDMDPLELDMGSPTCESRDVYFTNSGGVELGRITLTEPQQSAEVALSSRAGRTNRALVTYNSECTDVRVELLERYDALCFDFSREPCERIPDQNCSSGITWNFDGQSVALSDDNVCGPTPEEQGWTQYHTQIESCYPVYNGPEVGRFEVGRFNFPLCDDNVRGQHWCISGTDGSPSRCLRCEVNLYTCR